MPAANRDRPGHAALRRGRTSLPRHVYHVITATADRAPIFEDFHAARIAAPCLNQPALLLDAKALCWVLMPDHLHWLVQIGEVQSLSRLVQRFKSGSAFEIHRYLQRQGRVVWESSFYDRALRRDDDIETVAKYIVGNPLRAQLCETLTSYSHWDSAWQWDFL